jgi:hypothetical protein
MLAWNCDPPDFSLPFGMYYSQILVEMGSHEFSARDGLDLNPPDLSLSSS